MNTCPVCKGEDSRPFEVDCLDPLVFARFICTIVLLSFYLDRRLRCVSKQNREMKEHEGPAQKKTEKHAERPSVWRDRHPDAGRFLAREWAENTTCTPCKLRTCKLPYAPSTAPHTDAGAIEKMHDNQFVTDDHRTTHMLCIFSKPRP